MWDIEVYCGFDNFVVCDFVEFVILQEGYFVCWCDVKLRFIKEFYKVVYGYYLCVVKVVGFVFVCYEDILMLLKLF